jgi:hypothetical protein
VVVQVLVVDLVAEKLLDQVPLVLETLLEVSPITTTCLVTKVVVGITLALLVEIHMALVAVVLDLQVIIPQGTMRERVDMVST